MTPSLCLLLSLATIGLGALALVVGIRASDDGTMAKVGGSFIIVIGIIGIIGCLSAS